MWFNFLDHMEKACLSPFNNLWSSVHDFTPVDGDGNWRKLPTKVRLQEYITPPFPPQLRESELFKFNAYFECLVFYTTMKAFIFCSAGWTVSADSIVIPISLGITDFTDGSICFVLIFGDSENKQCEVAMEFLSSLLSQNVTQIPNFSFDKYSQEIERTEFKFLLSAFFVG